MGTEQGLTEQEQRLVRAIAGRADALFDDLRRHVETPTGGGNLEAIESSRAMFADRLAALGASVSVHPGDDRPWWLGTGSADAERPVSSTHERRRTDGTTVLIAGHLDTVHDPKGPFQKLEPAADGLTAIGPGCVDMKGGLVIAMSALEALDEVGLEGSWSFFLNSDEETGTYHSEAALRAEAARHDWGIALEPALGDGSLAIERPGSGQFMIEARGKSAHVGRAFTDGISAVNELARVIMVVAGMPDPANGRIISIGPLQGNNATNAVPDRARAWGNVRFSTPAIADDLTRMLGALETAPDALPGVTVHRSFNRPAKPRWAKTDRLALTARGAAEDLGQSLPFASTGGVCDGNIMQDAGLPTIDTMGVRGGGLHTPDEWIELPSLVERCQLLALTIHRLHQGRLAPQPEHEDAQTT